MRIHPAGRLNPARAPIARFWQHKPACPEERQSVTGIQSSDEYLDNAWVDIH